jgi:hypothetical protein
VTRLDKEGVIAQIVTPETEPPVPDEEKKTPGAATEEGEPSAAPEPDASSEPEEAGETAGEDKYAPDAIAARVARFGEESDAERVAREEEQKLAERRRQQKKGGKKGLQTAASKRLAKIGEGTVKRPTTGLAGAVSPEADPLVERAANLQRWVSEHGPAFRGLLTVGVLGLAGVLGYTYWQDKRNEDASAMLAKAFADQHGHVSDKEDTDDDDEPKARGLYPTFKSTAERRDAAIAKYRAVESKYGGTGAAILARLGEASLLLDAGDAKGALAAYDEVRSSALGRADSQVRGRAIEGKGFAYELLAAQSDAAEKDKDLEAAASAYRDLSQVDVKGLKELGLYHQARVQVARGDKAKAIELLKEAHKLVSEPGEERSFAYLQFVVEDRLRELDPSALPPKAPKPVMGAGGGPGSDDPRIQELLRQLREQNKGGPPLVPPPSPPQ